jgi:stage II sporulation protein E
MAILSDGMGSGEKACADSEVVVDMAEKLMDAGFSIEMTVQMINDVLLAGAENMNMSTLDLCGIDLYDGIATFAKIGSACTYIKSGDKVEKLSSTTLPLGIFHKQEVELIQRKIRDGDYIVMLSDGIMDCIVEEKGELFIKELISDIKFERPNEIAGCIMKYVLNLSKGRIRDDMTVLVMGFWENKYED